MRSLSAYCLAASLAVSLVACSSEPASQANDRTNAAVPEAEQASHAASNDVVPADNGISGTMPAADAMAPPARQGGASAWTGRFAATPDLCRYGAWNIWRDRIVTGGETSCTVRKVDETGRSVVLTLACRAEGNVTDERWTLTPGPNDALAVRRDTGREIIEVDLRRCT